MRGVVVDTFRARDGYRAAVKLDDGRYVCLKTSERLATRTVVDLPPWGLRSGPGARPAPKRRPRRRRTMRDLARDLQAGS